MEKKLYVGNLSYDAGEEDLRTLFQDCGQIERVDIIKDKMSGRSKGFAFVEMATSEEAEKALELNGKEFLGRNLNISEARPRQERDRGGHGGGGGGRGRGGFGGGGGGGGRDRDRDQKRRRW